jgi:hypothetical protein
MTEKLYAPDGFEEKIDNALKNKEPCPAQVEYPLHDGETMAVYCDIGAIVNCEHKGPRRRFAEGSSEVNICEVNVHHTCLYNPGGKDKEPPKQKMMKPKYNFWFAGLSEEEFENSHIVKNPKEYLLWMTLNFVKFHIEEMAEQANTDNESGSPNVPLFDELISKLEEACPGKYKEVCKSFRDAFYNSAVPDLIKIPLEEIGEKRLIPVFNYYKEVMKDKENDK